MADAPLNWRWLWIGLIPLGFLAYLWLNHHVTGEFFRLCQDEQEHWYRGSLHPGLASTTSGCGPLD